LRATAPGRQPALTHADLRDFAGHGTLTPIPPYSFYQFYDLSVRRYNNNTPDTLADDSLLLNSLEDLTMPENRFAHQSLRVMSPNTKWVYPFHPHLGVIGRPSNPNVQGNAWRELGLPTLREMAHPGWGAQSTVGYPANVAGPMLTFRSEVDGYDSIMELQKAWQTTWYDLRAAPHPFDQQYPGSGVLRSPLDVMQDPDNLNPPRTRAEEDVVLENVVGFDVKVWDPEAPVLQYTDSSGAVSLLHPGDRGYPSYRVQEGQAIWNDLDNNNGVTNGGTAPYFEIVSYGAYVDLDYVGNAGYAFTNIFRGPSARCISLFSNAPYWEYGTTIDGLNRLYVLGGGTYDTWSTHYQGDGVDNDQDGQTDGEDDAPPPYSSPLRGLKVTVRVFEPYSRKIREVTITQDFMDK